jgi:uroporphyrin-III C-methyltransferase/precorrin-2 dehydrogenase/sirohydrochlorin ferrochelatase
VASGAICHRTLPKEGKEPDWASLSRADHTPIAIIENGTRPDQRVITGTLAGMAALVEQYQVQSPALLVIGEVVALQAKLAWYGTGHVSSMA